MDPADRSNNARMHIIDDWDEPPCEALCGASIVPGAYFLRKPTFGFTCGSCLEHYMKDNEAVMANQDQFVEDMEAARGELEGTLVEERVKSDLG